MKKVIKKIKSFFKYIVSGDFLDFLKEKIAICLFKLGRKPSVTLFIDEKTIMYGYGKCHSIGIFEYNLPAKYVESKKN